MGLVSRIRRAFHGEPKSPDAERAIAESRESLAQAISSSTDVNKIVSSLNGEMDRNHFIDLLYATRGNRGNVH